MRIRESIGYVGVKPERRQKDKGYQSFRVGWKGCRTARLRPRSQRSNRPWNFTSCQCVLSLMTWHARSDSVAEARPGRDCAHSAVWSKSWEDLVGVKPQRSR